MNTETNLPGLNDEALNEMMASHLNVAPSLLNVMQFQATADELRTLIRAVIAAHEAQRVAHMPVEAMHLAVANTLQHHALAIEPSAAVLQDLVLAVLALVPTQRGKGEPVADDSKTVAELKKALRPFVKFGERFDDGPGGHKRTDRVTFDEGENLTVGDFLTARAALKGKK